MGDIKVSNYKPAKVSLIKGKEYFWCACGYSKQQPYCDGSHKTAATDCRPIKFTADKDQIAFLCNCKKSNQQPFCDGSHKEINQDNDDQLST